MSADTLTLGRGGDVLRCARGRGDLWIVRLMTPGVGCNGIVDLDREALERLRDWATAELEVERDGR